MASFAKKRRINFRSYQKKHGYACKPGDNFDAYVNGTWVKTIKFQLIKLPTVLLMSCMINLKRCKSDYRSIKGTLPKVQTNRKLAITSSFMNRKDRAKGIAPIQPELKILMLLHSDLAAYFGKSNRTGVSMPSLLSLPKILKPKTVHFNDLARRIRSS
jgi:putative endopeptidase